MQEGTAHGFFNICQHIFFFYIELSFVAFDANENVRTYMLLLFAISCNQQSGYTTNYQQPCAQHQNFFYRFSFYSDQLAFIVSTSNVNTNFYRLTAHFDLFIFFTGCTNASISPAPAITITSPNSLFKSCPLHPGPLIPLLSTLLSSLSTFLKISSLVTPSIGNSLAG